MKLLSYLAFLIVILFVATTASAQCSGERWPVKIGTDADANTINLNAVNSTTIANLISVAPPTTLQDNKRSAAEKKVYSVAATLKKFAGMYDLDYHMVISDAQGRTMIAEIPSPTCVPATSPFAAAIAHARAQFDAVFNVTENFQTVEVPVHITGVGFFDYKEGQSGQAPNGIELHPVLDITFDPNFALSASPPSVSVTAGGSSSSTIMSTVSGPFNANVALSVSGLPSGATATFNPATIPMPGSGSSTLTISTDASTPSGTYNVMVTGTGGGQTHTATVQLTVTSTNGTAQLIGNPGFENGSDPTPWTATPAVIDNSATRAPHTGAWKAWLDGYGTTHTDTLQQTVTIPSTIASATLSFWLHIDTQETTTTAANDTLQIQLRDSSGAVLSTLASYSNLNPIAAYNQVQFDLSSYKGQTIQIYLVGTENSSLQTSFIVDDFALVTTSSPQVSDFAISASPSALTILAGNSGSSTISTTISGNFNSTIALAASGVPPGVAVNFNPPSIAAPGAGSAIMTISAGAAVPPGTYTISVVGSGGSNHSTTVALTVGSIGGGTTQQLLSNAGFENGSASPAPWSVTAGVIDNNSTAEPAHTGTWKAWLDGYGTAHTDTLWQQVAISGTASQAALSFWLHVDTQETTTTKAYDTLTVQVRDASGTVLQTLATYSNLNAAAGYQQVSFDLSTYKGQTIQIYLIGIEDTSLKTSFVVDDFALNVTTP